MKKLTIEQMREIAGGRRGRCLSDVYVDSKTKLRWRCADGHEWKARPNHVKEGSWCLHCSGGAKKTIGEMQKVAKERGGECLSEVYVNSRTKLRWRCADGHEWKARPHNIKRGQWCPVCAGKKRLETRRRKEGAN